MEYAGQNMYTSTISINNEMWMSKHDTWLISKMKLLFENTGTEF